MRIIAFILFLNTIFQVFSPFLCYESQCLTVPDSCCIENDNCSQASQGSKSSDNQRKNIPFDGSPCCIFQIPFCSLSEPIRFDIKIKEFTLLKTFPHLTELTTSGFLSFSWKPPELI